jgi:hypothetical protein
MDWKEPVARYFLKRLRKVPTGSVMTADNLAEI